VEVPGVVVGLARAEPAARVAGLGILDFDHLGAERREASQEACLELGEVDHLDAGETLEVLAVHHR
jgi:hypothetical protein